MSTLLNYLESDSAFAQVLFNSFMKNIEEFRTHFQQAVETQEEKLYMQAYCKIKTTLGFTGNVKLLAQCNLINNIIKHAGIAAVDARLKNSTCRLCSESIEALKDQLNHYSK
jgi:hypothetical protein